MRTDHPGTMVQISLINGKSLAKKIQEKYPDQAIESRGRPTALLLHYVSRIICHLPVSSPTAQHNFLDIHFPVGTWFIRFLFSIKVNDNFVENDPLFKVANFPSKMSGENAPALFPPTIQECMDAISLYGQSFDEIIAIFMSSQLTEAFQNMEKASKNRRGKVSIVVIDFLTTSIGLGSLVQVAAEQAAHGSKLSDIEHKVKGKDPNDLFPILYC